MRLSLKRVLLGSMAAALLASLVPAGFALDRRLSAALEANVRTELARAPVLLEDRNRTRADALMMHAQEAAATVGLAGALADGDRSAAAQLLSSTRAGEEPIVVDPGGSVWLGPEAAAALLPRTQQGESPVAFVRGGDTIYVVSIAPVEADGRWRGAAGVAQPVNEEMLATLAGLTASEVIVVGMRNDVLATTASEPLTRAAAAQTARWAPGAVREDTADAVGRYWAIAAPLGDAARVVFVQDAQRELALLPQLRRDALLAGAIVLRNAREAMPEGGRTHVEVRSDERGVSIEVADEGPGIPEDVLPRIFDPFFTTKGSARGIGLGLFVAEGLARRYGGRLRAHNRPDGGACFTIELPSAGADLAPATAAAPAGDVRGLEEST